MKLPANHVERARILRLRYTLWQAGRIVIYGTTFALIICYGAFLSSPWWQATAR
jgi:hypothetical protein